MNTKNNQSPRLSLTQDGEEKSNFPDSPQGRKKMDVFLKDFYEQKSFLENFAREKLENWKEPVLRRVFKDGYQELERVPSKDDERPSSLAEAKAIEAARVDKFLNRNSDDVFTRPLTREEHYAHMDSIKLDSIKPGPKPNPITKGPLAAVSGRRSPTPPTRSR